MISMTSSAMGPYILRPAVRNVQKMKCIHTILLYCISRPKTIDYLLETQQSCKKCSNFHRVECKVFKSLQTMGITAFKNCKIPKITFKISILFL